MRRARAVVCSGDCSGAGVRTKEAAAGSDLLITQHSAHGAALDHGLLGSLSQYLPCTWVWSEGCGRRSPLLGRAGLELRARWRVTDAPLSEAASERDWVLLFWAD
ncbi:hypothetical protein XELAEV_18024848mg [Xenopus laevis]|uniref:Uncharacterized protein n=1 Tax=Xenopus laevis TaxID=8355 RepID=A0A974D0U0_XENLA|nr:hypothetical protein XELAEV_18024848mg [Xenopus laevis]